MTFNFDVIMDLLIPHIVIFSLIVGFILKKWMPLDNKYIPTVLVALGALLGGLVGGWDFEHIVAGMLSALASTGLHQTFYQYMKIDSSVLFEVDEMGKGDEEEKEEEEKEDKIEEKEE